MIFNRIRHRADRLGGKSRPEDDSRCFAGRETVRYGRLQRTRAAFTLIELLVVLGIIAAVVGGVGLALRGGDDTVALGSAQRTVASMLTATRAQAVMNGTTARLIIHVDSSEPEHFLRRVGIIKQLLQADGTPYSPPRWVPTSDGTALPRGTYFVPGVGTSVPAELFSNEWNLSTDAISLYGSNEINLTYPQMGSGDSLQMSGPRWAFYEFGPDGQMTSFGTNQQIVLTTGRRTQTTPVFENPENVRGLVLRRIGTFHLVNERLTFHGTN